MPASMRQHVQAIAKEVQDKLHAIKGEHVHFLPAMTELALTSKTKLNSEVIFFTRHLDAPFILLPCKVYRVLVGIQGCNGTQTVFPNKIITLKTYDAMAFDYDRTPHYIVSTGKPCDKRILLKMQFHAFGRKQMCNNVHVKWAEYSRKLLENNQTSITWTCQVGIWIAYLLSYFLPIAVVQLLIVLVYSIMGYGWLKPFIVGILAVNVMLIAFSVVFIKL